MPAPASSRALSIPGPLGTPGAERAAFPLRGEDHGHQAILPALVPPRAIMSSVDELPAMGPASISMGQSVGRLDQCWIRSGYGWCPKEVNPEGIGLCAEHLEELRTDG